MTIFGHSSAVLGVPPDWHANALSPASRAPANEVWFRLSDFSSAQGDIKGIWEASRFEWAVVFARAAVASGEGAYVQALNVWMTDWMANNPPYLGPNWKCGQEASIRLLHVLLAQHVLRSEPTKELVEFATLHLNRIQASLSYAEAQDNNHWTSEAAALFVGGAWLARFGGLYLQRQSEAWMSVGRRALERSCSRLIFEDGGFSQYSVNYHRMMLETLCQAELWRRHLALEQFPPQMLERCRAATRWLASVTNAATGDWPNLGANDGSWPFRLHSCCYRDARPTVQLASNLFLGDSALAIGEWDEPLRQLELERAALDENLVRKTSRYYEDFGLSLLNPRADGSGSYAFVRVPRYRFRPSQADALHFDLWAEDGANLLSDAGSYSYFDAAGEYFSSTRAHNTIEFDGNDQMPKLSRFLYGDWLNGNATQPEVDEGKLRWSGSYTSRSGIRHRRTVEASGKLWEVCDSFGGFQSTATIRWRLPDGVKATGDAKVSHDRLTLAVYGDEKPIAVRLIDMPYSHCYASKASAAGLEVSFGASARTIRTVIEIH